jgi:hypothetical protein
MHRSIAATIAAGALTLAVSHSGAVFAAPADATEHQIYEAAMSGHLDQAQQMMDQVLRDHPQSAKAHYDQAELYAREGKTQLARSELAVAEQLKPGLPDERPQSVAALKAELGLGSSMSSSRGMSPGVIRSVPASSPFPWGIVLIFVVVIGLLWMVFRRRNTYVQYPGGPVGGAPGTYGQGYGPGYGPAPMGGGGIGSGIAGGLASGLAVGAGVVAGEELAHHFLDGGRPESGGVIPPADAGESGFDNGNMGGSDFGSNDPGSSWDDGGSDGGGGGDWS